MHKLLAYTRPSSYTPPRKKWSAYTLLIIAIIIVGGLIVAAIVASTLSVSSKSFVPYSAVVSTEESNPNLVQITNVNGPITIVQWNQPHLLVNGTVTARGIGASADAVKFITTNTTDHLAFQVILPTTNVGLFLPSYTVDIKAFVPVNAELSSIKATTTNGNLKISTVNATTIELTTTNGSVEADNVNTTTLRLDTTNGGVNFNCSSCTTIQASSTNGGIAGTLSALAPTGSYQLSTTNGSVNLTLPSSGSFRLTASTVNGVITTSGLGLSTVTTHNLSATIGTGTAAVNLDTTNGSVTVTGV